MKKFLLLLLSLIINYTLLITNYSFSQSGWYIQNTPLYYSSTVFFLNDYTGWGAQRYGVSKTTNQGLNWILMSNFSSFEVTDTYFINEFTGWVVGSSGWIMKTTNSGVGWSYQICLQCTTADDFLQMQMINENTGYVFGDQRIVKTTNGGIDWIPLETNSFIVYRGYFFNADTGFIVGLGALAKTTNGGMNWIQNHFTNSWTSSVYFRNLNTGWISSRKGEIFKTTNGGNNWAIQYIDTAKIFSNIIFTSIDTGWAIGFKTYPQNQSFVLKTINSGQTWFQQQTPVTYFEDIYMKNSMNGWIAGDQMMHTTNGGGTVKVFENNTGIPSSYSLSQNYPNPFNAETKIKFEISSNVKSEMSNDNPPFTKGGLGGFVSLKVFDITGKEVAVLVNEQLQPGTYEVEWNASAFSSGIYFYQLRANNFVQTKKLVLLK